jgi:hypothetical protein
MAIYGNITELELIFKQLNMTEIERKAKSESFLKSMNVPINSDLPPFDEDVSVEIRTKTEIVNRLIALTITCAKSMGAAQQEIQEFEEIYEAHHLFSPNELRFINDMVFFEENKLAFGWQSESILVLLWSLGLVDKLNFPSEEFDTDIIWETVLTKDREQLLEAATLRTKEEILDQADIYYRLQWAIIDAEDNNNDLPAKVNPDVVEEWNYAFEWLTSTQEWDEVGEDE